MGCSRSTYACDGLVSTHFFSMQCTFQSKRSVKTKKQSITPMCCRSDDVREQELQANLRWEGEQVKVQDL